MTSRRLRLWLLGLVLGASACNTTERLYLVQVQGTVQTSAPLQGPVTLEFYHARGGTGIFASPLLLITRRKLPSLGSFQEEIEVPIERGEGLVVYAWLDLDKDGRFCSPSQRSEVSGLTEIQPFPTRQASVSLSLEHRCLGPEALYP